MSGDEYTINDYRILFVLLSEQETKNTMDVDDDRVKPLWPILEKNYQHLNRTI